jgi:hypothetical protein
MIIASRNFFSINKNYQKNNTEEIVVQRKILINIINKSKKIIWIRLGSSNFKNLNTDIDLFSKLLFHIKKPIVLVTGDGDRSVFKDIKKETISRILKSKKITKWFTQNYDGSIKNSKVKPYPIGLDLSTNRGKRIKSYKQILNCLNKYRNFNKKKQFKVFCDVHLSQYNKFNNPIKNLFIKLKYCKHFFFLKKKTTYKNIVKFYSNYAFVISAHGNGLDCHRTWEALYLGAIVIVKTSSLDNLYKDLPVIIVNNWNILLNYDFLISEYNRLKPLLKKKYIDKFFSQRFWIKK